MAALNPDVRLIEHPVRLDPGNALDLIGGYDVVADGSDNFATRYLVNDACFFARKPLVTAAIDRVPHRFLRTIRHPAATVVGEATSFDGLYEAAARIEELEARLLGELGEIDSVPAAEADPSPGAQAALLPDISLVADLLTDLSPEGSTLEDGDRFRLREIELGAGQSAYANGAGGAALAFRRSTAALPEPVESIVLPAMHPRADIREGRPTPFDRDTEFAGSRASSSGAAASEAVVAITKAEFAARIAAPPLRPLAAPHLRPQPAHAARPPGSPWPSRRCRRSCPARADRPGRPRRGSGRRCRCAASCRWSSS